MSKSNIYSKEWLEVVFADKNKTYGAYQLRKNSSANAAHALIIGSIAFILLFFAPKIYSLISGNTHQSDHSVIIETAVVMPPKPLNPKTPPPIEPPKPKVDQLKMTPPIVKPDILVKGEPPTIEKLKLANPGPRNITGDPTAEIQIADPVGDGPKRDVAAAVGDGDRIYDQIGIERQPEFPGGLDKFYKYLGGAIKYPSMAQENGVQGKVFLTFVVEKDGSLTDIQVVKGPGSGTNEEAIRVLKESPRWHPGIQNGVPVRVKYNIAVNFNLQ
ncbi:protein TonB [Pedobacter sp. UYP30]|uniref:energy transducer TonB n=1 Tax=Pedobacter sp. UYP30 TaxID=1756400 RepID=UPI003390D284